MTANRLFKLLFSGLFILTAACAKGQQLSVGIKSGITINHFNISGQQPPLTRTAAANGYFFSLPTDLKLRKGFIISTGVTLLQKNYSTLRTGYLSGLYQDNHNTYIQIPMMMGWQTGSDKFKITLNVGIYNSYWLTAQIKGQTLNIFDIDIRPDDQGQLQSYFKKTAYNEGYKFNSTKDQRYEFGAQAEVNLSYMINRLAITLTGAYQNAITDHQKKYMLNQPSAHNHTMIIAAGIKTYL